MHRQAAQALAMKVFELVIQDDLAQGAAIVLSTGLGILISNFLC